MYPGSPLPVIDSLELTWQPLSFIGLNLTPPSTTNACDSAVYDIAYSLSFVDDTDVVIHVPLPSIQSGSYTPSYGQNTSLVFETASNSGMYTTVGTSVTTNNGSLISVPANSIYWHFPTLTAGDTGILKFTVQVPCNLENGATYDAIAYAASNNSSPMQTNQSSFSISSSPIPFIEKNASNVVNVGSAHYLYEPYASVITYRIGIQNRAYATEAIFAPTIVDDLSHIQSQITAHCT